MKKIILLAGVFGFAASLMASAAEPKDLWTTSCAKCHGADGKGGTKMGQKLGCKDYTDAAVQSALTDEAVMKPAQSLSDADIKGLVTYLRAFKK